ncbi:MAG: ribosome-associated translation inhibitor RaiA [Flavobacteriaceae bacterium]|nr:MAG: ribosome-associated translation inhibitor RaiA [Flavobacteriaceae bacterium]
MKAIIQSVNFNVKESLKNFVDTKVSKLSKYTSNIIDTHIYLKLDNNHSKENKIVELKVHLPKDTIVVVKESSSFESALNSAIDVVKKSLRRKKRSPKIQIAS